MLDPPPSPLPIENGMALPLRWGLGSAMNPQSSSVPKVRGQRFGSSTNSPLSLPPASSTSTVTSGSSANRRATTEPAVPDPQTMKSYCGLSALRSSGRLRVACFSCMCDLYLARRSQIHRSTCAQVFGCHARSTLDEPPKAARIGITELDRDGLDAAQRTPQQRQTGIDQQPLSHEAKAAVDPCQPAPQC